MTRLDRRRIAELERWHARQDCVERGHTLPGGYTHPDSADLDGLREQWDVTARGSSPVLTGLPEGVGEVPCAHCGDAVLGVDLAERGRVAEAERVERERREAAAERERAEERRRAAAARRASCVHGEILDVTSRLHLPDRRGLCARCDREFTAQPGGDWYSASEEATDE